MLSCSVAAMSQVPNEMAYQIMVLDPDNGRVMANEEAEIRIELRKDSPTGEVAWSNTFTATTDQRGICNLTLEVGNEINWGAGEYYFAAIINGKECGAPKITSVPYAFCATSAQTAVTAAIADQASSLKGVPTREQLIGTWTIQDADGACCSYIFNEDGTGTYSEYFNYMNEPDGGFTYTLTWKYTSNGLIFLDIFEFNHYEQNGLYFALVSDSQAYFLCIRDEGMADGIYTKQ